MRNFCFCCIGLLAQFPIAACAQNWRVNTVIATGIQAPEGLAVDGSGDLYVVDKAANAVLKFKPSSNGYFQPLPAVATGLNSPDYVAVDTAGTVYVTDGVAIRRFAPSGTGNYTQQPDAVGPSASFGPVGIAVDRAGNLYVTDVTFPTGNADPTSIVHKYVPDGSGGFFKAADIATDLYLAFGVAVDDAGSIYVTNYKALAAPFTSGLFNVKKYSSDGSGGYTEQADVADGIVTPQSVAVTSAGDVYLGFFTGGGNR